MPRTPVKLHPKPLTRIRAGYRVVRESPILIAGGGIAGLTLALSLARRGFPGRVLEAAPLSRAEGGGIQLAPNAVRILNDLGVGMALYEKTVKPDSLLVSSGKSGQLLARFPLGRNMERRYGAFYLTAHRNDLQGALRDSLKRYSDLVDIVPDAKLKSYHEADGGIRVTTTDGCAHHGRMLVGADGLRSSVRTRMLKDGSPRFSGYIAWRACVKTLRPSPPPRELSISLRLGWNAHVVSYPIRENEANLVAVVKGSEQETENEKERSFRGWHKDTFELLEKARSWKRYPLFDRPKTGLWHKNATILIGDAAHPILPFFAQGGAMAIEDAATLSFFLTRHGGMYGPAFRDFERIRRRRIAWIRMASQLQGMAYHFPRPLSLLRNALLWLGNGTSSAVHLDWIYAWHPPCENSHPPDFEKAR